MQRNFRDNTLRWISTALFFGGLLLLGLWLTADYGMGWDEPTERDAGYISLAYVARHLAPSLVAAYHLANIPELATYADADHGVAFQLPMAALESVFFRHDLRGAYWMRHFLCFATFVLGTWAVYQLGRERFGSWRWGLLGAGVLVLSPRIFAEAFYNYKDLVFMNLFAVGGYTLVRLLRRPTAGRALVHAFVTALATDVRTMGLLLPALTVGFGALEMWARPARRAAFRRTLGLYAVAAGPLVVLFWPYLWEAPGQRFWQAFKSFRHYRQGVAVLYWGRLQSCQSLPWHYLSTWIIITTPVAYSLLFFGGVLGVLRDLFRQPPQVLRCAATRRDLLFGAWCGGTLVLLVGINSVVYDGWRHVYFVYPAFLLLALRGLWAGVRAWQAAPRHSITRRVGWAAGLALGLSVAHTAERQVADHPHQYAYFSCVPASAAARLFERDYWGVSSRSGLEWLLAHDRSPLVTVSDTFPAVYPVRNNMLLLPIADQARLRLVSHAKARYFLGLYRWHPGPYDPAHYGKPVHEIRVGGLPILTVFQR